MGIYLVLERIYLLLAQHIRIYLLLEQYMAMYLLLEQHMGIYLLFEQHMGFYLAVGNIWAFIFSLNVGFYLINPSVRSGFYRKSMKKPEDLIR